MDIRTVQLPTGRGEFSFPIKIYRNRMRKNKEPYILDIELDVTNNEKLEEFILNLV